MQSSALARVDARILSELQKDSSLSNQELASRVGLAASPCWRRVRAMEEAGTISGYRAILDRRKLGFPILVFVRVRIGQHSEAEALRFERQVADLDQIVACYSISGDADFLLQVAARDLDEYSEFALKTIRALSGIKEMQSMFVLSELKAFSGFPIPS